MGRLRAIEAWQILCKCCEDRKLGQPSSSRPTQASRNEAANDRSYWAGVSEAMTSDTERTKAYLTAYIKIAGDAPIYATGLLLDRGHMPLDKSVMHRLVRDGYAEFDDNAKPPRFIITPSGKEWLNS